MLNRRTSSRPNVWSTWLWVNKIASHLWRFSLSTCCRRSGEVSMRMTRSWLDSSVKRIQTLHRRRLSFGLSLVQTSQSHSKTGTPADVPVPKKVNEKLLIVTLDTHLANQWTYGKSLQEQTYKDNTKCNWHEGIFEFTVWQTQNKRKWN